MRWLRKIIPHWQNALLALLAAGLLTLAFPDFEFWFLAWFALVPLMWAVEREGSVLRSFVLGWLFGTAYFFGTCWWLTYAPIHYASMPWPLAYLLILIACLGAGVFPGVFAAILSVLLKRFGSSAFLAAPFVWVFTEFARYWLTGNSWNAIGYSQAFGQGLLSLAAFGGVYLPSFVLHYSNGSLLYLIVRRDPLSSLVIIVPAMVYLLLSFSVLRPSVSQDTKQWSAHVVAVQPNVPASGLTENPRRLLRDQQIASATERLNEIRSDSFRRDKPVVVILPESPMNFMYNDDREFQQFVREFTTRNNVSLLFNSAEPDAKDGKYFNSAVMVGTDGKIAAQYDKVYLLPFGEAVPVPLESIVPAFVGSFSYGSEYDLLPVGDAKAGVMICFESHFGQLSREYVRHGADMIIEMTNDGYLGPTPVLRQHLANAVFRAIETNRPVLRVTNVGITTYIDERGMIHDPAPTYTEATRVWTVSRSNGSQTMYVRFGDWFAWLCTAVTLCLMGFAFFRRSRSAAEAA